MFSASSAGSRRRDMNVLPVCPPGKFQRGQIFGVSWSEVCPLRLWCETGQWNESFCFFSNTVETCDIICIFKCKIGVELLYFNDVIHIVWIRFLFIHVLVSVMLIIPAFSQRGLSVGSERRLGGLIRCWKLLDSFAQNLQEETLFKSGQLILFDRFCNECSTD